MKKTLAALFFLLSSALPLCSPVAASLWTDAELAGQPGEERQGPTHPPDISPPDLLPPDRAAPLLSIPPVAEPLRGNIRSVKTRTKAIALTFDLCELSDRTSGYDWRIVDLLRRERVRATFYASGKWLRSHPVRAQQIMSDPLFEMGNHAWTHGNFGVLPEPRMREQIDWTQAQYALLREQLLASARFRASNRRPETIPARLASFRLPYGRCSPAALDLLAARGLPVIQWSIVAAEGSSPERLAKGVLVAAKPGDIVLMHANGLGKGTAQALPAIVRGLQARGFTLLTVSELLGNGAPVAVSECYFERPGDNLALDAKYGDGTAHPGRRE